MGPKKKKGPINTPDSLVPAKKENYHNRRYQKIKKATTITQVPTLQQDEPLTTDESFQPLQPQTQNIVKGANKDEDDDDDDDDDYSYEDTESDDGDSMEEVETNELVYLLNDQDLTINKDQIPSLYYPTLKNRLYATVRSVTIEHIYAALKFIFIFTSFLFILAQIGRLHTTVSENGYCNSRFNDSGGETMMLGITGQPCIPCPNNGECINGELYCKPLYRPYRSFMNEMINMVWPTGQQCIRDPIMINYATKMEQKIRSYLSQRQGDYQCKHCNFTSTSTTFNKRINSVTHPIVKTNATYMMETLKHTFGLPLAYNQNHQIELDHLPDLALDLVKKNKHVMHWEIDGILYLGTDIAKYSFLCWCWVTLCGTPLFVKISIPVLILGYALLVYLCYYYQAWTTKRKQVELVTKKILDILKSQRQKHLNDSFHHGPGCSASYLRQHAMDSTHEDSIIIWNTVVAQLQKHPCLRHGYTDENGDLQQYFEWL